VSAIEQLITELARLPGIGRKTAQRLTFHLLQQPPESVGRLASALVAVGERVRPCEECGNLTEDQPCAICRDPRRDPAVLCVVEDGPVREVILATNPSMEGEVTATYIQQLLAGHEIRVTRLARGLPMGGDLEYVDGVTLAHALTARQVVG
jgi:recombination protein RecR